MREIAADTETMRRLEAELESSIRKMQSVETETEKLRSWSKNYASLEKETTALQKILEGAEQQRKEMLELAEGLSYIADLYERNERSIAESGQGRSGRSTPLLVNMTLIRQFLTMLKQTT